MKQNLLILMNKLHYRYKKSYDACFLKTIQALRMVKRNKIVRNIPATACRNNKKNGSI